MKRPRSTKPTRSESGQVLVIVGLIIVTLIACTALASDVGFLRNLRRQMQTAADAAAIAGAREIFSGNDSQVSSAATADATSNGFTTGNGVTVTINNPPVDSSYSSINGNSQDVEVIINKAQPTFFMRVLGISTVNVAARAVAGPENSPYCVYLLSQSASPALQLAGIGTIQASCGLVVDSGSTSAIQDFFTFINDTSTGVVGNVSGLSFLFNPTPVTGIAPVGDPLADLTQPTPGSCTQTNFQLIGGNIQTISPGTYCGGIQVHGASALTLSPGTYILDGGGLTVDGGSYLTGNGVTIFNTGNSAAYNAVSNPAGYAAINMNGFQLVNLVAPTTGNYAGILMMTDRTLNFGITDARFNNVVNGLTLGRYEGTLYFPTMGLTWNGVTGAAYTLIVAQQLGFNFLAFVTIGNNFTSLPNGSPIKTIGTLE